MGEAFQEFMSRSSREASDRLKHCIDHAVEVLKKDQITDADIESVWQEFRDLGKDLGTGASEAAAEETKERLIANREAHGYSREEAEEFFEPRWKEVVHKAESLREAGPTIVETVKLGWLKIAGWMAAAVVTVGVVVGAITSGMKSGTHILAHTTETQQSLEAGSMSLQVTTSQAQFDQIRNNLKVPSIDPPPQVQAQQPESAQNQARSAEQSRPAAVPAQIPLPITVASVAHTRVAVTVIRPNTPIETFQTNLGSVYRSVPEARPEIERRVIAAPRREIHGNIDVRAEFAHIKLKF